MPVTNCSRRGFVLACVAAAALTACGEQREPAQVPPTNVDLATPVQDLPGWTDLLAAVGLDPAMDRGLADFVDVFREGLDISRRVQDSVERQRAEDDWWASARRTVEALVGAEGVDRVMDWLEERFGRRRAGGAS